MSTDYNYDEQGQFFPYFVLTITAMVVVPVTVNLLRPSKEPENTAPRIQSEFKPDHADLIDGQRRKQKRRELKLKRIIFACGGWLLMAYMVYLMAVTAQHVPNIWDPYSVLGISRTASEKQIKSHYRRLSLTQHPDKAQLDPEKNITTETVNEHWVEITKAFKALTDEEVRRNFLEYGHPDGKQSFSIGIALPSFIVTEGNGKYVLMLYGSVLGILLPYLVGRWWYGTQRFTKERVLVASAGHLFREYKDDITEGGVIGALSSGEEYQEILKGPRADAGQSKVEQRILSEGETSPFAGGMSVKDRDKLQDLDEPVRRKALALLWAYLGRVELDDAVLGAEMYEAAPTALTLNDSFTTIALAYGSTHPVLASYKVSQSLIQAVAPGASPLFQLPHFTPAVVRAAEGENARTHLNIQDFMRLPPEQRRNLTTGRGLLTNSQYEEAMKVASQMPYLKIEKAFFKVAGERVITPNSLVQFVVKARVIPPGYTKVPEVNPKDLQDVDLPEGEKEQDESLQKRVQPALAHAPYYARDHSPRWHIFLADGKQGRIAVPPTTYSTFDKPVFDENGKPTFNLQTFKMQFGAPPQEGKYTFVMQLCCDSYVGFDTKMDVTMDVADASQAEVVEEEGEISEPEEDSLAGQMKALKGRKQAEDEDSSDGSDTEGDEGSDTSETDTDTDTDEE